jgi:hypothetical protein
MTFLSFIDDELRQVKHTFGDAKEVFTDVLGDVSLDSWTFTHKKTHLISENETKDGKKLRIVECFDGFDLNELDFGCERWKEFGL